MILHAHPSAGWSIRSAVREDRVTVEALFLRCLAEFPWRGPRDEELIRMRRTLLAAEVFVAEVRQAGVIGFVSLEGLSTYVPHLFVDRDWRYCGIGRGLLDVAREKVGGPLKLDVDRQNERAIAAYQAMGWRVAAPAGARRGHQIRLVGP